MIPRKPFCKLSKSQQNRRTQKFIQDSRKHLMNQPSPRPSHFGSRPVKVKSPDEQKVSDVTIVQQVQLVPEVEPVGKKPRLSKDAPEQHFDASTVNAQCAEQISLQNGEGLNVPATAKTLRKTKGVKTLTRKCAPGEYFHYGIQKALEEQIVRYNIPENSTIDFDINIDGLGVNDRSERTLWPILGRVVGIGRQTKPFVIGVYHGFTKPRSAKTFLRDFVKEYKKLKRKGFLSKNERYTCNLECAICDALARSFVKCTAQHNGFYGCDKCHAKGKNIGGRLCYLKLNAKKRTNIGFRTRKQKLHHFKKKRSIFECLKDLDMIKDFPLDPMQLVYLGDVKYLLNLISEFNNCPDKDVNIDFRAFNNGLEEFERWIPAEFSKKRVKDLKDLGKWKATHGRFFLSYASIPLVHRFLPPKYAEHMYKFTCAIRILSDADQYKTNNAYANELLRSFVQEYKILCGKEYLVYNMHNLIHLAEEALRNGPLDSFSAFFFGNFMRTLKGYLRKPEAPLQQIHLCLKQQADFVQPEAVGTYPIESGRKLLNLPLGYSKGFSKILFQDYELSTSPPDNVCVLKDQTVVFIDYFGHKDGNRVIIGKRVEQLKDIPLYLVPSSSHFMISIVSKVSPLYEAWPITCIYRKAVTFVIEKTCYVIPLLHKRLYGR
ncbi:hypothetical protein QAD02_007298 [Eretmocerus hayati]|uniref:Uncharacterized protein n=1 Tax=Eretmocerus hayati TaxID=131215 RepID=A0ACC2N4L4_9HYME|nr:hypothetical protein QAD02_007298 [Eretmocerus hayati]